MKMSCQPSLSQSPAATPTLTVTWVAAFGMDAENMRRSGAGRTFRATDGEPLDLPDFGSLYQNRVRVLGRRILAAVPGNTNVVFLSDHGFHASSPELV